MGSVVEVTEKPAVETFNMLRRISELVEHGEMSLTTAGYILNEPLGEVTLIRDWKLPPCTIRNTLVARYCDESVKELLTADICTLCSGQPSCTERRDEVEP